MNGNWRLMVSVLVAMGTGCPTEWGMEGAINQAVRRDLREIRNPGCAEGQQEVLVDPNCVGAECLKECKDK